MWLCTAHCKILPERDTKFLNSPSEERNKRKTDFGVENFLVWHFVMLFRTTIIVWLVMKVLEQYIVIKSDEFTIFEILRD